MSRILRALLAFVVGLLVVATPTGSGAPAYAIDPARYVSGGTVAARVDGSATLDEGYVVCDDGSGAGAGGFCVPFGGGDAVWVDDAAVGPDVAFQVCIDNSGDGVCTSPDAGACADVVVFSHHDDGAFHNPVGPLPTGFTDGCGDGAYQGYVVFLCEGVHIFGTDAHAHPATTGTGGVTTGGEGTGNFCGGNPVPSRKAYVHPGVELAAAGTLMTVQVGCFGCGTYGPAGNAITWECVGACLLGSAPCVGCVATGSFTIDAGTGAGCVVSASLTGTLTFPSGPRAFQLTLVGNVWTMTWGGATSTGVVATREPAGIPCGSAVMMQLIGVAAGA